MSIIEIFQMSISWYNSIINVQEIYRGKCMLYLLQTYIAKMARKCYFGTIFLNPVSETGEPNLFCKYFLLIYCVFK